MSNEQSQTEGGQMASFFDATRGFFEVNQYIMPHNSGVVAQLMLNRDGEMLPFESLSSESKELRIVVEKPVPDRDDLFMWNFHCKGLRQGTLPFLDRTVDGGSYHLAVMPVQEELFYSQWGFDRDAHRYQFIVDSLGSQPDPSMQQLAKQVMSNPELNRRLKITADSRLAFRNMVAELIGIDSPRSELEQAFYEEWTGLRKWGTHDSVLDKILATLDLAASQADSLAPGGESVDSPLDSRGLELSLNG